MNSESILAKLEKIIFLPFVLFFRVISPLIYIRITPLKVARIGHLVAETEIFLCKKELEKKRGIILDLFYIRKKEKICNNFIFNKIKKKIFIIPSYPATIFYQLNLKLNNILRSKRKFYNDNKIHYSSNFFKIDNQKIKLTNNEIKNGYKILEKINIFPKDKFVCLVCRDSAYLKKKFPEKNFDYHSYRNANIQDFMVSCDYLTEKGYKVVRIGNVVEKSLITNNPNIIDYSSCKFVSDFLDIFLIHECKFMISTSTGIDEVASIFRKPMVMVNFAPIGTLEFKPIKNFVIFKKYFCYKKNRDLRLSEIFETKSAFYQRTENFEQNKIGLINNSSEDILLTIKDCVKFVEKQKVLYDKNIQNKFWNIYLSNRDKLSKEFYNGELNIIINDSFLKKNKHILN